MGSGVISTGQAYPLTGASMTPSVIVPPPHHLRLPSPYEKALPFKIEGVYCRLIPLGRGLYSIVDADDYERLAHWRWNAFRSRAGDYYARRNGSHLLGETRGILMHREIVGLSYKDGLVVDHIQVGATLDNRRKNLRIATYSQNGAHRKDVAGVSFHPRSGLWRARVCVGGKEITSYHKTKPEAYAQRRLSSAEHFGEFAPGE